MSKWLVKLLIGMKGVIDIVVNYLREQAERTPEKWDDDLVEFADRLLDSLFDIYVRHPEQMSKRTASTIMGMKEIASTGGSSGYKGKA